MKLSQWLIIGTLLIAPAVLVVTYLNEFMSVDSTLDSGASYNYQTGKADYMQNHPYLSFSERQGVLINIASLSFLTLVVYGSTIYFRWKKLNHVIKDSNRLT